MTKAQAISQMLIDKMTSVADAKGCRILDRPAIETAIDHVLGDGTYAELVSNLYDELRAIAK
ncbi:hypothetical protein [Nitrobacter sp.]|uniref:hypothetical protein n=1 Tax=Nitrobacter sp. TaxID=29420 RepID=UPI0029CAAE5D|nr:hypothetical protein [Nitrobacter sp.]